MFPFICERKCPFLDWYNIRPDTIRWQQPVWMITCTDSCSISYLWAVFHLRLDVALLLSAPCMFPAASCYAVDLANVNARPPISCRPPWKCNLRSVISTIYLICIPVYTVSTHKNMYLQCRIRVRVRHRNTGVYLSIQVSHKVGHYILEGTLFTPTWSWII